MAKPPVLLHEPFDKLRASGGSKALVDRLADVPPPFGLSLSKPLVSLHEPFDKLRASGGGEGSGGSPGRPEPIARGAPLPLTREG